MKKIAILSVVAALAAAAGWYILFNEGAPTPRESEGVIAGENRRIYVTLDPITTTIFREQEPAGLLTAAIILELTSDGALQTVNRARSRLHDAMFRELHAMLERERYTGRKIDVDAIKQRMLAVSRRELGDEIVRDLFVNALLRKGA